MIRAPAKFVCFLICEMKKVNSTLKFFKRLKTKWRWHLRCYCNPNAACWSGLADVTAILLTLSSPPLPVHTSHARHPCSPTWSITFPIKALRGGAVGELAQPLRAISSTGPVFSPHMSAHNSPELQFQEMGDHLLASPGIRHAREG